MGNVTQDIVRADRVSYADMVEAIDSVGNAFISQLCVLHPNDGERPVPQLEWTVAETAVHMLTIVRRGLGDRRRSETIPGLAVLNDECIAEVGTRVPLEIADALTEDKARLIRILRGQTAEFARERSFPLHAGLLTDIPTALSYMLFDFLAHGLDIARGIGQEWQIRPEDAALALRACLPALGPWAKEEVVNGPAQEIALSFPGDGDPLVIQVGDGSYAAQSYGITSSDNPPEMAVEVVSIEVDPVDAFLAVAGRASTRDPHVARLAGWFDPI